MPTYDARERFANLPNFRRGHRAIRKHPVSQLFPAPSPVATWMLLLTIAVPYQMVFYLWGDLGKFTAGRLAIVLLFVPSLARLLGNGRRIIPCDLFAFATAAWMIGSRFPQDGLNQSAVAEVIEFFGGYVVARAYFFGPAAIRTFVQVLKPIAFALIAFGVFDPLLGTNVIPHLQVVQFRIRDRESHVYF